jgi:hypothetical protein
LDGNDNWFISTIEMEYSDLQWVKELPLIDYVEPTTPPENE